MCVCVCIFCSQCASFPSVHSISKSIRKNVVRMPEIQHKTKSIYAKIACYVIRSHLWVEPCFQKPSAHLHINSNEIFFFRKNELQKNQHCCSLSLMTSMIFQNKRLRWKIGRKSEACLCAFCFSLLFFSLFLFF